MHRNLSPHHSSSATLVRGTRSAESACLGAAAGGGGVIIIRRKQCYPIWHVENNQWQSGNLERLTPRVLVSAGLPGCGRWVGGGGGWW